MMKAICSSKSWVLTRATQRNIPEDGILHDNETSGSINECFLASRVTVSFSTRILVHRVIYPTVYGILIEILANPKLYYN
jgi:hypothetical protein